MSTVLRTASLLDILAVLQQQDGPRGVEEMAQTQVLDDPATPDHIAAALFQQSVWAYAMTAVEAPARALAVAGFIRQRKGVYRTWMYALDEAWEKYAQELTAHVAGGLKDVIGAGAHRIEAICLDSRARVHRWYNRIGLQKEATLTRYCTDGTDAALFVLTRSDN